MIEQLPKAFLVRMKTMLGKEYEDFLKSYEAPRQFGLRVNTLKISVEEFLKQSPFHLTKVPWTENGFYYEEADRPDTLTMPPDFIIFKSRVQWRLLPFYRLNRETIYWIYALHLAERQRNLAHA